MDSRVKSAVLSKIEETVSNVNEISKILQLLSNIPVGSKEDLAFGIAIGRIYNSFHYQTRRVLKRNSTEDEFIEFLDIISKNASHIRNELKQQ